MLKVFGSRRSKQVLKKLWDQKHSCWVKCRWVVCFSLTMRLRYTLIFLSAVVIVTIHHIQKEIFTPRLDKLVIYEQNYYENDRDPDVTCDFPILHPFDERVLSYIKTAKPIRCFARAKLLTLVDREGVLRFNFTALAEAGYSEDSPPKCFYQEVFQEPGDDFEIYYGNSIRMSGNDKPLSDFVYVNCYNFFGISIYENYHASVQRQSTVREFKNDQELGVAVIGLDSMSRLNFMRQLPLSYRYITDTLEGVVLLGFNKVGENTYPNLVPMLTGRPCAWGKYNYFENWPFVWNQFEEESAATLYAEDLPEFNTFAYLTEGFRRSPTKHYMRTFWLAVEKSMMYRLSSTYCLGAQPKHVIYFQYLLSFLRTYNNSPTFLFSLFNEASHDYINTVGAIDEDLREFLETSYEEGLFNRTVVLILGDHGNRIDPFRLTEVGRIEDRMPMVSVVMPAWTRAAYPGWREALLKNSKRLVSSYDIHATFLDILDTLRPPESEDPRRVFEYERLRQSGLDVRWSKHFSAQSVERSFFSPVSVTRDCDAAGVPDLFCVCPTGQEKLSPEDERGWAAASAVVDHFNTHLLRGLSDCASQTLTKVESAVMSHRQSQGYRVQVMFGTQPGDGVFEATVDVLKREGREEYQVVGELLRVNRYGTQADCLPAELRANSTILRGVCYCTV